MARSKPWKTTILPDGTTHEEWLPEHCQILTKAQISQFLGRSVASVAQKLRREGLMCADDVTVQAGNEIEETVEGIPIKSILQFMKDKPQSIDDLAERFDRSPTTMRHVIEWLLEHFYAITQTAAEHHVWSTKVPRIVAPPTILWDKDVWEFKFGAMSDWHDGSKAAQISARNKAIGIMYKEGVRDILVVGDINTGYQVYRGQELDIVSPRPDHQTAITEHYCPRYEGLRYHIMAGNHDYDFVVHGGHEALFDLCERREDFLWYGYDLVTVRLTEDVDALMWHPSGSSAYAMCLSEDSQILTRRGWATPQDISLSDEVLTLNPETGTMEYQHPEELFIQDYRGPMISFEGRAFEALVTPDHDLWINTYSHKTELNGWSKKPAGEVAEEYSRQKYVMKQDGIWIGNEPSEFYVEPKTRYTSPNLKHIGSVPIKPFLRFLGWWISEGNFGACHKRIDITQKDEHNTQDILAACRDIGLNPKCYRKYQDNDINRICVHSVELAEWMEKNAGRGSYNKRVPDFIKGLSPALIEEFLDTLFRGDGSWREGKCVLYTTVSEDLANDVQELLLKTGRAGTVRRTTGNRIIVGIQDCSQLPSLCEQPTTQEYEGKVWCVRVPNGIVYTRRNGKPVWTGNSYRSQKMVEQLAFQQLTEVIKKNATPKVRFVFVGHWHNIFMWYEKGPINVIHTGGFEGQNNLTRRIGHIDPHITAMIISGEITKDRNLIRRLRLEPMNFTEIEDDYLNYPVPQKEPVRPEPLFQWAEETK